MQRPPFQLTIVALLGLVACIALNLWLFRLGPLLGIVGLNISKHLVIAYVCQILGVDRRRSDTLKLKAALGAGVKCSDRPTAAALGAGGGPEVEVDAF
jgi:hypothetical protein